MNKSEKAQLKRDLAKYRKQNPNWKPSKPPPSTADDFEDITDLFETDRPQQPPGAPADKPIINEDDEAMNSITNPHLTRPIYLDFYPRVV